MKSPSLSIETQAQLLKIIECPIFSEKTDQLTDQYRQYVFKVLPKATKPQIQRAVELQYGATVQAVRVLNVEGKKRRFKQVLGKKKNWKKAYVTLRPGQEIDFTGAK